GKSNIVLSEANNFFIATPSHSDLNDTRADTGLHRGMFHRESCGDLLKARSNPGKHLIGSQLNTVLRARPRFWAARQGAAVPPLRVLWAFAATARTPFPEFSSLSPGVFPRSEEHTSELQSRGHLVCRLLLEKKKKTIKKLIVTI